jgi:hypothetical protein
MRGDQVAPNDHILQRGYDRRRNPRGGGRKYNLAVGFSKSLDQVFQVWGKFGSLPPQDYAKSVRDFIANRAGVCAIDLNIYAASFRHGKNSAKSKLINMSQ